MGDGITEITASWKGESTFIGHNSQGGIVQMGILDGKPGVGPMQLLLVALAGCTGMDIISILKKKNTDITEFQVRVRGTRADDHPMIWTQIHISYQIWGNQIISKDVDQAIKLSENKYCSVGIMLSKSTNITSDYSIMKPGELVNL